MNNNDENGRYVICQYISKLKKMQVDVLNIEGKKTGRTVELPEEIFGIEPNDHVI